eukprot:1849986-Amphidinium_carterae.1
MGSSRSALQQGTTFQDSSKEQLQTQEVLPSLVGALYASHAGALRRFQFCEFTRTQPKNARWAHTML